MSRHLGLRAGNGEHECTRRYHLLVFPCRYRHPFRYRHWWRGGVALAVLLATVAVVGNGHWILARIGCRPSWHDLPTEELWAQEDGGCVGVSDGPYDFRLPPYTSVFAKIGELNRRADEIVADARANRPACQDASAVTIGVLMPLAAVNVGARGVHELESFAATQAATNTPATCRPIKLRVGNMGKDDELSAPRVAALLAVDPAVVAVVGMGLSNQNSALATRPFSERRIPMVADLITAEGFDHNGSAEDQPDFSGCRNHTPYSSGIGDGHFFRVSFRDAVQVSRLASYVHGTRHGKVDKILTPTDVTDPTPCTGLKLYHRAFGDVDDVKFTLDDPATLTLAVRQICDLDGEVTVVYAARGRDQARFLVALDKQRDQGTCKASSITVIEGSDGSRIRVPELTADREDPRRAALTSPSLRSGYIKLIVTPLADPQALRGRGPALDRLAAQFTDLGFDAADLDDGWGISAHDALRTVTAAIDTIPLRDGDRSNTVTSGQIETAIGGFSTSNTAVPDAIQTPLLFDNNGNRKNLEPALVRICPVQGGPFPPDEPLPRTTTVPALPLDQPCPGAAT